MKLTGHSSGVVGVACAMLVGMAASPAPAGTCEPDFDGSGGVDILDLFAILANWEACPPEPQPCPWDLDGNGDVGVFDFVLFLDCFGLPCPCPPLDGTDEVFDQIVVVNVTDPAAEAMGLVVTHMYATGDNVAVGDKLLAVFADPEAMPPGLAPDPGGTFYQHQFGNDLPPNSGSCVAFPELCYDTYVAMACDDPAMGCDNANNLLLPEFFMDECSITGAWTTVGTTDNLAVDIGDAIGQPGKAGVHIGQVTLVAGACPLSLLGQSSLGYGGTIVLWNASASGGGGDGAQVNFTFDLVQCPWDCADGDGTVGINDFLALLAQWDTPGSCDFDGGGGGITDFLALLANWGPCP